MVASAVAICLIAFLLHRFFEIPASVELWPAGASPDQRMAAVFYARHGNVSVLEYTTAYPQPILKPNQVLIRVHASSLNPCDFKYRRNYVPNWILPKPKIPGDDVAGVVVLSNTNTFLVGDRVAAMLPLIGSRWGAAAEFVAVDANLVAPIGVNTDFASAASLPLVALTTIQALNKIQRPTAGKRILIQAGAGGVGTFAIQYAKHVLGMYVAATASAEKGDLLRDLGCDQVIDYRSELFESVVRDFDVVLDPVSWAYEDRTVGKNSTVLKSNGHYLNIGSSDWKWDGAERSNGPNTLWNAMYSKARNLVFPGSVPRYDLVFVSPNGKQLQDVMDLLDNSTIRAVIDRTFHLADAAAAYEYLEQGRARGKVILFNVEDGEFIRK